MTIHTATNFRVDRETAELGEAWPAIREADAAYTALRAALQKVQATSSQRADNAATEFLDGLCEARADASWLALVADAQDAFEEARVRPIKRGGAA